MRDFHGVDASALFRKRAVDLLRHKFQLAAADLGRGSVIYMREVLERRLLRSYLRVWRDARAGEEPEGNLEREMQKAGAPVRGTGGAPAVKDAQLSRVHPGVSLVEEEMPPSRRNEDLEGLTEFLQDECDGLVS